MLLHRLGVKVRKRGLIVLERPHLFELFLDPAAALQGQLQVFLNLFPRRIAGGMQQLDQSGHSSAYSLGVARVQMAAQAEIPVKGLCIVLAAQLAQRLGQVIHYKAVMVGKELVPRLGDLPAGQVKVEAIDQCHVLHFFRQGLEQCAGAHQHVHGLVDVPVVDYGGFGDQFLPAPAKAATFHIVLEDLDGRLVAKADASHLVKGNHIPHSYETHPACAHIVKEVGHGGLAARDQDGIG